MRQPSTDLVGALRDAGALGSDLLAVDWASTPLGPPEGWSRSLTSIVRVVVSSRFSMWMCWGPQLTFFCNDAYRRDTLAAKYPWALGRPTQEVWEEIWPEVGPRIATVMSTGEATWDEALMLFLERSGFREETYHTFSYSPLTDDDGSIAGMLCVVAEETERVVGERHLAILRDLGAEALEVRDEDAMLAGLSRHLAAGTHALPFTLTYLLDGREGAPRLAAASGVPAGHPVADRRWPVGEALATGGVLVDLGGDAGLPRGPWDDAPTRALVLPLARPGQEGALGVLVAALNPYRPVDATYRAFVDLVAAQVASGLASARAYDAERRRAESLAELDRAKTAFFTNVSHELRTPLTLLLGPAEDALEDRSEPLGDGQRHRLEVIARNGRRMLTLVNTLLDFSRIESGGDVARFEPVDLVRATRELLAMFESAAEVAGLELRLEAEELPGPVHVDREAWTKVVSNLVSNALKHTFAGAIVVRLRAEGGEVVLEVADTGIGIAREDQERLFERFHRVEGARSRSHEGTGIGLALVAELVAQHGGRIEVRSAPGEGSTFAARLPLGTQHLPAAQVAEAASAQDAGPGGGVASALVQDALRWLAPGAEEVPEPAPQAPVPPGAERRPRVLVVDDNADMRRYIADLLRAEHDVEQAPDGGAALEAARRRPPDLVLTDVMMPVLDGFGLLRALREDPTTAGIPVIMLSARGGEESTVEGLEAGADDYLVKPFAARELLARVDANLELERVRRARDELGRSRSLLDQAERLAGMGSWELEVATDRLEVSNQLLALFGMTREELEGVGLLDVIELRCHPADRPRLVRIFEHALATAEPIAYEARIVPGDGGERLVAVRGEVLVDDEGRPATIRGSMQDVTEQRRVEAELAQAASEREVAAREHEIATELQRSLLPIRAFEAPGMEVATYYRAGVAGTQVGGDWFDVIELPDGRTAIVLGDVMGRGVAAAAIMGQLRAAVRAYARLDLAPAEVLTLLDGVVGDLGDDQMATCVLAVYDPESSVLRYASGGHLPPLLREPGRGVRRLSDATGAPLGSGVSHPGAAEVHVAPGAVVALYTDGLVERRGAGVDEGIDLLASHLGGATVPLVALPGALVAELVGEEVDDDVAVLVARLGPEGTPLPEVRRHVDADPRAVPEARHETHVALAAWGVDERRRADVALLVSELVTNAVLHAREPIELVLTAHPQHVLVEVIDGSPAPPDPREAAAEEESGRGLTLVESLAVAWGGRTTARGKVVWAVVER